LHSTEKNVVEIQLLSESRAKKQEVEVSSLKAMLQRAETLAEERADLYHDRIVKHDAADRQARDADLLTHRLQADLQAREQQLEQAHTSYESRAYHLRHEVDDCQKEIVLLRAGLDKKQAELAHTAADLERTQAQLRETSLRAERLHQALAAAKAEGASYLDRIKRAEETQAEAAAAAADALDALDRVLEERDTARREAAETKEAVASLRLERGSLQALVELGRDDVRRLKGEVETAELTLAR
jgi:chromosome segregation ATPase